MMSRTRSSALFRSSMSVLVPYHLTTFLCLSRSGTARIRNQRYCPSARRRRASFSKGSPAAKAARHSSFRRSSGWNAFIHPQPSPSSKERPVYSRKCWLRKSAEPSGNLRQIIAGIASMMNRRRSSIAFDALSAPMLRVLDTVWLMVPSSRRCARCRPAGQRLNEAHLFPSGYKQWDGGGYNHYEKQQEYSRPAVAHGDRQVKGQHPDKVHRPDP